MNLLTAMYSLGVQVEAGIVRNHDEAIKAWREEGRLPTAEPPASPVFIIEGNAL